jgi:hypothetical protein
MKKKQTGKEKSAPKKGAGKMVFAFEWEQGEMNPFVEVFEEAVKSGVITVKNYQGKFEIKRKQILRFFYESCFVQWIGDEQKKEMTKQEYLSQCTIEKFTSFIDALGAGQKRAIEEKAMEVFEIKWKKGSYIGELVSHEYAVDAVENYHALKEWFEKNDSSDVVVVKESHLQMMEFEIRRICKLREFPFEIMISNHLALVISSNDENFHLHLAIKLMTFDLHKIGALLDAQFAIYEGEEFFPSIIEHGVYDLIKDSALLATKEKDALLDRIMQWVERNRKFISTQKKEIKLSRDIKKKTVGKKKVDFYYWRFSARKLKQLHDQLLLLRKISVNKHFDDSFRNEKIPKNFRTNWKGTQTELIYLFHLLNNGKQEFKHHDLQHIVLSSLFLWNGNEMKHRGLQSKYAALVQRFDMPAKLPNHLLAINELVVSLELSN